MSSGQATEARAVSPHRAALSLSGFLPYRLSVLAAVVSDGLARTYGTRFGIGIPEWRVLATVAEFGSVTATTIGQHAHMNKVKVSRAAAALEARQLIGREPNAEDLRESFLTLTREGRAIYDEIAPLALDYVGRLTDGLARPDLDGLDRVIDRLVHRARELGTTPP